MSTIIGTNGNYITQTINGNETDYTDSVGRTAAKVMGLHVKKLGCWCKGTNRDFSKCHGHVVAKWADKIYAKYQELKPDEPAMQA